MQQNCKRKTGDFMKFTKLIILTVIVFFSINSVRAQNPADASQDEVIKIGTKLVRMSFISPATGKSTYEIFEGDQKIEDFKIISPADEPGIEWVLLIDFNSGKLPEYFFNHFKKQLKRTAKQISPPTIVVNTENMKSKKFAGKADIPDDWKIVEAVNIEDAFSKAGDLLKASGKSRKSFFWMTTEQSTMTRELLDSLPKQLTNTGLFAYIATVRSGKMKLNKVKQTMPGRREREVGRSNLSLNTTFAGGASENLADFQFETFLDQCLKLNLAYYTAGDEPLGPVKIFSNFGAEDVVSLVQRRRE